MRLTKLSILVSFSAQFFGVSYRIVMIVSEIIRHRGLTNRLPSPSDSTRPVYIYGGGFANAADRQRIEALVCRGVRSAFYSADSPTVAELVSHSDDNLFENVLNNDDHLLHKLLPERSTHDYNLIPRSHSRTLCLRNDRKNLLSRVECCLKTFISYFTSVYIIYINIYINQSINQLYSCL